MKTTLTLRSSLAVVCCCLFTAFPSGAFAQAQNQPPEDRSVHQGQADQSQASQDQPQGAKEPSARPTETPKKNDRIFGVIPNYRTVEGGREQISKMSVGEKFKLGLEDSFDPYAYPAAGIFAGLAMWQKQTPSFGQGAAWFGKYYGTAFADQTIGNMMSESVFPVMLHQDPRYFPRGRGSFWKRTGYSISREWITRNDSGQSAINYSELVGNAVATAISNAYYPAENRTVSNNAQKFGQQIGLDAFFNILKEYWPDIRQKVFGK